jgi:DNA recombination protein RmuC
LEAAKISEKYIVSPYTTDFAIMFVPTEGLYAEIVKQEALLTELNRLRVIVAGPLTLSSIVSSLRMGFQTIAISARADEVWKVLSAVKTEFGKFGGVLAKVKKQLNTAAKSIEESEKRARAVDRKLGDVQQLPASDARMLLALPAGMEALDDEVLDAEGIEDGEFDET